ncbi:MAG: VCBS repeat-containing protein [Chryseolinea sp.]
MKAHNLALASCAFAFMLLSGCSKDDKQFRLVPSSESGVTFSNILKPTEEFNILNYMYFYNGGGVAIADLNGDTLADIFFTSNQEDNRLYLNRGDLKFEDITAASGTAGLNGWTTGVTTADVNGDGKLDLYVSYVGDYLIYKGRNQLLINQGNNEQGIPVFSDQAIEYGLDLVGFSTQAAFFDYDRDGDLDMFLLNHSLHEEGTFGTPAIRKKVHPLAGDKLLRNDGGHFIEVTAAAGIYSSVLGYGLGVVVSDVNLDGWLDIYVGNDFHENDYLYINQKDGTFLESLESEMMHTSRFTMGVDFGDVNNDAFPDLVAMDMLPDDPKVLKASAAEDPYDIYTYKINFGYNNQFARNMLQLNNRNNTFSDISLQAGVASTDWSWSALLCDFDLDGYKDIMVANGIPRRPNDLDYINFISADSIKNKLDGKITPDQLRYIDKMPSIKISNYLFSNNHDLTFTNRSSEWGFDKPSYSNGAAYGDLDNDGDVDLVINNLEEEAFIYENRTLDKKRGPDNKHYLQLALHGANANVFGVGTKVLLYDSGAVQLQECMPTRGFQSAVDYIVTFATSSEPVDSVVVVWNDGHSQTLTNVKPDQRLTMDEKDAQTMFNYNALHPQDYLFNQADNIQIPYQHRENHFVEFTREQLIPHMMAYEGPAAAVGDINNDGLEDIFLGGGKWQEGFLFLQNVTGTFTRSLQSEISRDSIYEDIDAVFFDADNDQDSDLLVVSGGNEFSGKSEFRNPRLYLNDGRGTFTRSAQLKNLFLTGSSVAVNDVDQDGDNDVFIGGRSIPFNYGKRPDSYLLLNDGKGNFVDATKSAAPDLTGFGFIKEAIWADIDNDKDDDLVIAAEWSPITILLNDKGKLTRMPLENSGLEKSNGWWNAIEAFDADNDGDMDLVAGNLGLNSKLKASVLEPVRMFAGDFDKNDSTDQVLTHFMNGKEYPFHTRDEMVKQMPGLKKRYLSYHKFSEAAFHDIFSDDDLKNTQQSVAYTFESSFIENLGGGKFRMQSLPAMAQVSTVNAILTGDFNNDKIQDIIIAGNFYPVNIQLGRYDASYGLLLTGDGHHTFTPIPGADSGLLLKGQTRKLRAINVGGTTYYIAVRNNERVVPFMLSKGGAPVQ